MANELWLPYEREQINGTSNSTEVAVYLPVSAVFPEVEASEATLISLLSKLSRTDALIWCARLNLIVSNPSYGDELNKQCYVLHNFFSVEDRRAVVKFMSTHDGPLTVFFRGQLLELMCWICLRCNDLPGDGMTFEDMEIRRTFAKAALIVSDLWGWRTYQDRMRLDEGVDAARRRSLGAVRVAYDAVNAGCDPMMAIARGRSLFLDHFVRFHPSFPGDFKTKTGVELKDYFAILCVIAIHYLNRTPEEAAESNGKSGMFSLNDFEETTPKLASISESYFAGASQTADELCATLRSAGWDKSDHSPAWRDFRAIRERPILRTTDGRAIVLDPVFFAESASVGPLFMALPRNKGQGDAVLSRFGEAFESYVNSVLGRMYPIHQGHTVTRLTCDVKGQDNEGNYIQIADACLNNVHDLVLFESKATWIRDDAVEHVDPLEYLRVLRERYSKRDDSQPKGAGQLANAIAKLATGKWQPLSEDFTLARRIYPVLLVHDCRIDAGFHAHILAEEFRNALAADETLPTCDMRKGAFVVAPLIILTIDTLEILERSVEHFSLVDLLRGYSQASPDRMMSVRNFLAYSDFGRKLIASGSLAESALKVLEIAKGYLGEATET